MRALAYGGFGEPHENGLGHCHRRDVDFHFDGFCLDSNKRIGLQFSEHD